jgi:hypothetical protein
MTGHDGQVTSGWVARPKRQTFTGAYKAQILAAYHALPEGSPERGELLRREQPVRDAYPATAGDTQGWRRGRLG